jgi:hypothetical protein
MTMGLSVQKRTRSEIVSFPRAWASSTPPTCAALDGRAPEQMGQPGRPLSRSRGSCAQNSMGIERENFSEGKSSCVHWKGIPNSRPCKCGAIHFNRVQRIACRLSRSAPLAVSGRKRLPKIGPQPQAFSPGWSSTGCLMATRFQTRGAWRSSVCSHKPAPGTRPITAETIQRLER